MATTDCDLKKRVDGIDDRVTNLENAVAEMRRESQEGFQSLSKAVNQLGHDFGTRMNTLDQRIVNEKAKHDERVDAEKSKWNELLRTVVKWSAIVILSGASVAMGVTIYKNIFI